MGHRDLLVTQTLSQSSGNHRPPTSCEASAAQAASSLPVIQELTASGWQGGSLLTRCQLRSQIKTSHNLELTTGLDSERKAHGEHPSMVVHVEARDGNLGAARH